MNRPTTRQETTAADLARRIEAHEEIHVLDVRAPQRLAGGAVDVVPAARFHNIPGSQLGAMRDPAEAGVPRGKPVVVVCGHGNSSRAISEHLNALGFSTTSLAGGVAAWMELVLPRELPPPAGCERLVQLDRIGPGALGYVLVSGGEALVVDPSRRIDPILDLIRDAGARLVGVADTHVHADYVSGAPALSKRAGVPYHLHPADMFYPYDGTPGRIPFEPAEDGTEIVVGRARVRVEHTPGHTEGSVCYRVGDDAILTGDFVFIGSIGRPDLGGKAREWTGVLWKSVERARATWPAGACILPAHYAQSSERNADRTIGKPFGGLPAGNLPLTLTDRERFTSWVLDRVGDFPESYRRIKAVNVGLESPAEEELAELETGKNQCALG